LSKDYLKELVGTKYIKPEPFCSLDENDNKPANISRHDGMQSPFMEEIHDTDMKSELSIEEWKPVLKELVGIAPVTLQEHRASPMVRYGLIPNAGICSFLVFVFLFREK
jgi:hypothetical protein